MICGRELFSGDDDNLCDSCLSELHELRLANGKNGEMVTGFSLYSYDGVARKLIHMLKYSDARYLARGFARDIHDFMAENSLGADLIVPVPMHWSKKLSRGYNQAELIALHLSESTGIPMDTKSVKRIKSTRPLSRLKKGGRQKELMNAFHAESMNQQGVVLVIDDIHTTGSTLDGVANAMYLAGCDNVYFITATG